MRLCNEMDEKAFEQKASQLRAKAVATCLSAGATNDEANDVAQEVMLRLWQMRQSLEKYRSVCDLVDEGVYEAVDLKNCVERRISEGGTAPASVAAQIAAARAKLAE